MPTTKGRSIRRVLEAGGLPVATHGAFFAIVALGLVAIGLAAAALAGTLRLGGLLQAAPLAPPFVPAGATLFVLAFLFLQQQGFVFHWGRESTKVSLDEIALFAGLLLLPSAYLVLAIAAATLLNQVVHRRSVPKAVFNVAQYAVAALVAAEAVRWASGIGVSAPWSAVPGPILFSVTTSLLVSVLFARIEGDTTLRVFRRRFGGFALAGAALGVSLGLIVYALGALHPAAILATLPVFLYLRSFGRLSEWADDELATHQLLGAISAELAGSSEPEAVAERILTVCHELLDCGEAQLTLTTDTGQTPRFWRKTFGEGSLGAGGITAPIRDAQKAPIGALTIFPKHGQHAYGEREHHILRTVAGNAAASAANAHALRMAEDANQRLVASEGRYRGLFETGQVLIHVLDDDGRIIEANPAARQAHDGREIVGCRVDEVLHCEQGDLLEALRSHGEVEGREARLLGGSATTFLLLDARTLRAEGQPPRHVVASRDITALKGLENELRLAMDGQRETIKRLENANRELEEFTLWTTHDMREPLRSIATLAQLLEEEVTDIPPEEARDMTRRIREGADRLKERVKALHAFSLIVQQDDAFEDVDLQAIVQDVLAAHEAVAQERGALILLPAEAFPRVRAQPHRIHQVVANLVENALKYSDGDNPLIELGHERTPDGWRFHVQDNGPGIPANYHLRIFQLFQRGPDTGKPGTGAGLAIVKRIVEQHGGHVWVESEPGQGARFTFSLPTAPEAREVPVAAIRQ